jgi:hypothetical protein
MLVERASSVGQLLAPEPTPAAALDAWYGALLACPGLQHGDAEAVPVDAGQRRELAAGTSVTARQVVWLQTATPRLRYPATAETEASARCRSVGQPDQRRGHARARWSRSASPGEPVRPDGGAVSVHADRRCCSQRYGDAAARQSFQGAEAALAVERLGDIAAFRSAAVAATPAIAHDPLAAALAVIAEDEGFELRSPANDDRAVPLFERLGRFADATGFRVREIVLEGDWWKEEGPAFLALEAAGERPRALLWRRRRWRSVDPQTRRETLIDAANAARLLARGYMIYPSLPGAPPPRRSGASRDLRCARRARERAAAATAEAFDPGRHQLVLAASPFPRAGPASQ